MNSFRPIATLLMLTAGLFGSSSIYAQTAAEKSVADLIATSTKNVERYQAENEGNPLLPSPALKPVTGQRSAAPDLKKMLQQRAGSQQPQQSTAKSRVPEENEMTTNYIFVSFSMPKEMLYDAFKALGKQDVLVFRGPVVGENMTDFSKRIRALLGPAKEKNDRMDVQMQIDPIRFKKCGIKAVPASCIVTANGPISAHGIMSGEYLRSRGQGSEAALGKTWPIAEMDVAEEIKRRLAGVTKEDMKRETIKSLFVDRKYVSLPRANKDAGFMFDPSVIRDTDMVVNGKILARKGQLYNPLGKGFVFSYIVFNSADSSQLDTVQRLIPILEGQKKSIKLIVSDFPSHKDGFKIIEQLSKKFGRPVTLLDDTLAKALRLRALPSVVESAQGKIIVNELKSSITHHLSPRL